MLIFVYQKKEEMKEWFAHEIGAMRDIRLRKLRRACGVAGIGLYWVLIEELFEAGNRLDGEALELIADENDVELDYLKKVVEGFGLFTVADDGSVSSEMVAERMREREERSELRRTAAQSRWGKNVPRGTLEADNSQCKYESVENSKNEVSGVVENSKNALAMHLQCTCNAITEQNRTEENRREQEQEQQEARERADVAADVPRGTLATAEAQKKVEVELAQLVADETVQLLLCRRAGYDIARDPTAMGSVHALIPEFIAQLTLDNTLGAEGGNRLALHFVNWLSKKKQIAAAERKRETRAEANDRYARETGAQLLAGLDMAQLIS